ncbi:hypothetical protein SO802_025621 [Lithocarpus litseifolius]|uniref:Uncharacterized protein n=1 Tax=Lithocarpus litseifolius TaxID=425828 RepID=A0AAW2BXM3_9ROSI
MEEAESSENVFVGRDYKVNLPDECLARIFHFLGPGDRKSARSFAVTKLALQFDQKSITIDDDALVLISIRCRSLTSVKLRGCRELTDLGKVHFAQNCKDLKKLSYGSCMFGAKAMNAVLDHCTTLEELSVKHLCSLHDLAEPIGPGTTASSLKSICLKELVHDQNFAPLIVGLKKLKTLKLIRCLAMMASVPFRIAPIWRSSILLRLGNVRIPALFVSLNTISY